MTVGALALAVLSAAPATVADSHGEGIRYRELTGDRERSVGWSVSGEKVLRVAAWDDERRYLAVCDPDGSTRYWSVQGPALQVEARREGDALVLEGVRDGRVLAERKEIGPEPWYQALSVALSGVSEASGAARFWMLRPDNLEALRLEARPQGVEQIEVLGQHYTARRVRVTAPPLPTWLWQASYWFRVSDGLMVRYESRQGPPGTPLTRVLLEPGAASTPPLPTPISRL